MTHGGPAAQESFEELVLKPAVPLQAESVGQRQKNFRLVGLPQSLTDDLLGLRCAGLHQQQCRLALVAGMFAIHEQLAQTGTVVPRPRGAGELVHLQQHPEDEQSGMKRAHAVFPLINRGQSDKRANL
jgi:hypothetical protein